VKTWETVTLEDVTTDGSDGLRRGPFGGAIKKEIFLPEGYKVYEQKHAIYGDFDSGDYFIGDFHYRKLRNFAVQPGDMLVSCSGTLGRVAIVPDTARPGIINQALLRIRPNLQLVHAPFLKMLLESPDIHSRLFGSAGGSAIKNVRPLAAIRKVTFLLPPLSEQKRIAKILDRAEALRAKRRAALALLDELTQSIFLDMFGDPGTQSPKYKLERLDSVLRRPLQNGAYYSKDKYVDSGGTEMVHMSDAFHGTVIRGALRQVSATDEDVQKYELCEDDLLIARRSLTIEGAAKPCMIPESDTPLMFESSFIRVSPDPNQITSLYLYHFLSNQRVRRKYVDPYITQSTISGINQSNLGKVATICPPLELQKEFERRVANVEEFRLEMVSTERLTDALFASLQHRAFRGEL
jgi:type I restriction enzyme S subunit